MNHLSKANVQVSNEQQARCVQGKTRKLENYKTRKHGIPAGRWPDIESCYRPYHVIIKLLNVRLYTAEGVIRT